MAPLRFLAGQHSYVGTAYSAPDAWTLAQSGDQRRYEEIRNLGEADKLKNFIASHSNTSLKRIFEDNPCRRKFIDVRLEASSTLPHVELANARESTGMMDTNNLRPSIMIMSCLFVIDLNNTNS